MSSRNGRLALAAVLAAGLMLPGSAAASAATATPAPGWMIDSASMPTNLTPGDSSGEEYYQITATNVGGAATNAGSPVMVTDTLPAGLTPDPGTAPTAKDTAQNTITCAAAGQVVTCTDPDTTAIASGGTVQVSVPVDIANGAPPSVTNRVSISGGGAAEGATDSQPTTVSASPAPFAAQSFDGSITNADGSTDTQAGSHPFAITTSFMLSTRLDPSGEPVPVANLKDVQVNLPPGVIGNPLATPRCTAAQFYGLSCPAASQVGTVAVLGAANGGIELDGKVYNMVPPAGVPAQFAFNVIANVNLNASVRSGSDYGLTISAPDIPQSVAVRGERLTFWGVPADENGGGAAPEPFLTLPATCAGPQTETLGVDSWQSAGAFQTTSFVNHDGQGTPVGDTGCGLQSFAPSLTVQPTTTVADSPSGAVADLQVPQNSDPNGLATPALQNATVTLPAGLSLSPGAAAGLEGCTAQEIALNAASPATCPDASKIGTASITSPLLPDPLTGPIFLGTPDCSPCTNADAEDGSMVHGYIEVQADGVMIKLPGTFALNPSDGQITARFLNDPQLPFSELKLDFNGGARGVLATPDATGTYTTVSDLEPWSSPFTADTTASSSFQITSGGVSGFAPAFTAGVTNATAGAYSPFVLSFSRSDTDQNLSSLSVKLPTGMLAKLSGVTECADADVGAGTCPQASQVGTVEVGSGPGPNPLYLPGQVYLTGPYKGAPFGLAVVVPAVAGPFNLGTVVVRQQLQIDPTTAQATVVSDPFPSIIDGIPLDIQKVDVNLNRPDFTVNPTSCDPMAVNGTLTSTTGTTANVTSRFQVGGCSKLGFTPKLKLALSGKGQTRSGDHPALTATLTDPKGQANIRSAKVTLPLSLALDPGNSKHVCRYATAKAVHGGAVGCGASTVVGTASVETPLLAKPLSGKVYLVQGLRTNSKGQQVHTLPSLLIPLRGQLALDLRAQSSVNGGGALVTTFAAIPDAPVSRFTLNITGGKRGLLVITGRGKTICTRAQMTDTTLGAQSGKSMSKTITTATPCPGKH